MGFLFGSGTKAAKIQAQATMASANMVAASDRENARASVNSMQTQIAQKHAGDMAAELLSRPQEGADVLLAAPTEAPALDPITGRRRTARSRFFAPKTSGLSI